MTWVRLSDDFVDNPKLAVHQSFGPLCGWQFVAIISYCNRYLTDGVIPKTKAHGLVDWQHVGVETGGVPGMFSVGDDVAGLDLCQRLLDSGHLEEADEWTYRVHDYLDYQPSREEILAERAKNADRQRRHRSGDGHGVSHAVTNGVSHGASHGVSHGSPVPGPVPVPVPTELRIEAKASHSDKPEQFASEIRKIFDAWVLATGRTKGTLLTDERREKIRARLRQGYSVDDCLLAVRGNAADPWHVEHRQTELTYVLRNGAMLEKFRDMKMAGHPVPMRNGARPDDRPVVRPPELSPAEREFAASLRRGGMLHIAEASNA